MAFKSTQNRTIVLPIPEENYELFVQDSSIAHEYIKYANQGLKSKKKTDVV